MDTTFYKRLVQTFLFAAMFMLGNNAWADTVTEGFDDLTAGWNSGWTAYEVNLPDGWDLSGAANAFTVSKDTYHTNKPSIGTEDNKESYLITPMLQGKFSFYLRNQTSSYQATITAYACTFDNGTLTLGTQIGSKTLSKTSGSTPSWELVEDFNSPTATRVALLISRAYFDDFTYTPAEAVTGPALLITDFTSGSSYNFGGIPVSAGTTVDFSLINVGTENVEITSIGVTGDYTITEGSSLSSLEPNQTATVTIATPAKNAEGRLTIESNDPSSPYTINLTSTYKEPAPIMGIDLKTVNFGKVTANASQVITVSNTGDAELTATISSNNKDFTIDPTLLTIAPEETGTFTITYSYKETDYGVHTATITVTPNVT